MNGGIRECLKEYLEQSLGRVLGSKRSRDRAQAGAAGTIGLLFSCSALMGIFGGATVAAAAHGPITISQASTVAGRIDAVNDFIFWLSVFFSIVVPAVMVWFVYKYHRSQKGRKTEQVAHSTPLEVAWTAVPLVLMLIIFAWGFREYVNLRQPLRNAMEINVVGKQWFWQIQYPNGRQIMNDVYVPIHRPVRLIMTSDDVIHGFYVPDFRLKHDAVPGRYDNLFFEATELGEHRVFCSHYCGTAHSDMIGKVIVLEQKDFDVWYETGKVPEGAVKKRVLEVAQNTASGVSKQEGPSSQIPHGSMAEQGQALYKAKACATCHSLDGAKLAGPTWKGIFGRSEELEGGKSVVVDENYIRESIVDPTAKVVKGFAPSMPPYKGLLSEEEIQAIIAFMKTLK